MKEQSQVEKGDTAQIPLDYRTDGEVRISIREKIAKGVPLDKREEQIRDHDREEAREDLKNTYPH
ncbi:hypothetical protein A2W67_01820 [Candidatus Nomurabacteria bacterium RIFCSPLOWO2_02_40_28]|uniref:Uncharacterized protein n=2 Tax=Candidatus Nomuraibacteriota TaxID=1752729 RepID=A0A837HQU0_9BACT|nr:MAG: hypothetical protein UT27_C0005G0014 [Candidatus Nomurabacteria bacterium GW2011_GWD2_39_12]KKR20280.1 MAG: hypothetical protein UT51_C0005G0013 [Candidatus Nomurabacteria bacterium GW2011_GWC2_39_41]KKR36526.1 MAG: hypothetical protein UT70_C0010G0013 [Candidatus Nomurabacteria bacterium GW2011_GWE2_40_10]KKR38373.1 MAG: hypothetical protein UT73_C0003G0013 [Candidatus Nomurabacteria bacterium GW2011_GWB1_40_11]KKR39872.1 MAG: hypothetical protein UT74_C0005G0089 [Parcubacteria group b